MAKVTVVTQDKAPLVPVPAGFAGGTQARAFLAGKGDPIHLHSHRLEPGEALTIGPRAIECLAYVFEGDVTAGGTALPQGSSLIVEHGAAMQVAAGSAGAMLLVFTGAQPPASQRAGGHVHLMPVSRIPRIANIHQRTGISGGLHADGACPTCELWLHENRFPVNYDPGGVHAHTEDEIIFITGGTIGLGNRFFGPGTALAIHGDTFYGFSAGPDGLSFINFRAGCPREVLFPDGRRMDEAGPWRDQKDKPLEYLTLDAA
jgi:hypothetical protein